MDNVLKYLGNGHKAKYMGSVSRKILNSFIERELPITLDELSAIAEVPLNRIRRPLISLKDKGYCKLIGANMGTHVQVSEEVFKKVQEVKHAQSINGGPGVDAGCS